MTPDGSEHVLCENYGWSLFGVIPLFCGNATPDAWFPWAMFRDDVTMDKLQGRVTDYAAAHGRSVTNLTYFNDQDVLFEIPGTQIPIPIPYVVTYREIQISGELR